MKKKIVALVCLLGVVDIFPCFSSSLETNENLPLIYFQRTMESDIPLVVPIAPVVQLTSGFTIDFNKVELYASVTIIKILTGNIEFQQTYFNTKQVVIDYSCLEGGQYKIKIDLKDSSWEGEFSTHSETLLP